MASIRARCHDCGDRELHSSEIAVTTGALSQYRFRCPSCHRVVVRDAEHRTLELLIASGVRSVRLAVAADPPPRRPLPGITDDDIIDAHELLDDDHATWALIGGWSAR